MNFNWTGSSFCLGWGRLGVCISRVNEWYQWLTWFVFKSCSHVSARKWIPVVLRLLISYSACIIQGYPLTSVYAREQTRLQVGTLTVCSRLTTRSRVCWRASREVCQFRLAPRYNPIYGVFKLIFMETTFRIGCWRYRGIFINCSKHIWFSSKSSIREFRLCLLSEWKITL